MIWATEAHVVLDRRAPSTDWEAGVCLGSTWIQNTQPKSDRPHRQSLTQMAGKPYETAPRTGTGQGLVSLHLGNSVEEQRRKNRDVRITLRFPDPINKRSDAICRNKSIG